MDEIINILTQIRGKYDKAGEYMPLLPNCLVERSNARFRQTATRLTEILSGAGVNPETIEVVLKDYVLTLSGVFSFQATLTQMQEALNGCKTIEAYNIDRYGLYMGLFHNYYFHLEINATYEEKVTAPTATTETKLAFIRRVFDFNEYRAVWWLRNRDILKTEHFTGISNFDIFDFITDIRIKTQIADYLFMVFIAKYALLATPEELREIPLPHVTTKSDLLEFAISVADSNTQNLDAIAQIMFAPIVAETPKEQEQAIKVAKRANRWDESIKTIPLREIPNKICSRSVEVAPQGNEQIDPIPIQKVIEEYVKVKGDKYGLVTSGWIYNAVKGVNLICNQVKPNAVGNYVWRGSLNKFSELVLGYGVANADRKKALLGALYILAEVYIVVDRPYKVHKQVYRSGKIERPKTGGGKGSLIRLIDIEYDIPKDDENAEPVETNEKHMLTITVKPDVLRGNNPTFITTDQYERMEKRAKRNESKSRFNYQLLTKPHKDEYDLIAEVFGYNEKRALAKPDDRKKVEKYIQGHHAANKRKLRQWFDEAQKDGDIAYTYNEKTETYSWVRLNIPKGETPTTTGTAESQGAAPATGTNEQKE